MIRPFLALLLAALLGTAHAANYRSFRRIREHCDGIHWLTDIG